MSLRSRTSSGSSASPRGAFPAAALTPWPARHVATNVWSRRRRSPRSRRTTPAGSSGSRGGGGGNKNGRGAWRGKGENFGGGGLFKKKKIMDRNFNMAMQKFMQLYDDRSLKYKTEP